MPQNQYRTQRFNPLGSADPEEELNVQTDSQGYHEIKVYNGTRDRIWELYSNLVLSNNLTEALAFSEQIEVLLLRADSIWQGIKSSANQKATGLGIDKTKSISYNGEIRTFSDKVKRYVGFFQTPWLFVDQYNNYDKEFEVFMNTSEDGKIQFLKSRLEKIVVETDIKWGELASKIGMGVPLKIAEEKELFFRG